MPDQNDHAEKDNCEAEDGGVFHFFPRRDGRWASVLPAADFDLALVRPSRSVFEAAVAALAEETRLGALVWDRALPADVLDVLPVPELLRVADAARAAFLPVTLVAMIRSPSHHRGAVTRCTKRRMRGLGCPEIVKDYRMMDGHR